MSEPLCIHGCLPGDGEGCREIPCPALAPMREARRSKPDGRDLTDYREAWLARGRRMNGTGEFADAGPWYPPEVWLAIERERDELRAAVAEMWAMARPMPPFNPLRAVIKDVAEALKASDDA